MRIMIADPQISVRSALKILLAQEPDLAVVAEVCDSHELLAQIEISRPNLVLLDWELPGQPIQAVLSALHTLDFQPCVIVLCGRSEAQQAALAGGANAFVSKTDPPSRLLTAIRIAQLENG